MKTLMNNMRSMQAGFCAALYFSAEHDTHYLWQDDEE